MYEPFVSKEFVKGYYPRKESSDSEEDSSKIGNTLWCSLVNRNQWLLMQKAFAAWINMKFVNVISKVFICF